jgi:hypothetical protein
MDEPKRTLQQKAYQGCHLFLSLAGIRFVRPLQISAAIRATFFSLRTWSGAV